VTKRSIKDLDISGKRVLIRVDFNVPIDNGKVTDDTRIRAALPTIEYARGQGATVLLASHLGRPKGKVCDDMTLGPVANHLSSLMGVPVLFASNCIGGEAKAALDKAVPGGVVLLENLRFHEEEEKNETGFSKALASLADVYVNDAFGTAHRAHASTEGIISHVHSAGAGLLVSLELEYLGNLLDKPARPLVAIIGGAKVSGKLEVIKNLLKSVDTLLIGGAMAYTFFKRRGLPVGQSLVEQNLLKETELIEELASKHNVRLLLPTDHIVTKTIDAKATHELLTINDPSIVDRIGVDIGPKTSSMYADIVQAAETVVWNGPMGVFEIDVFSKGTLALAKAMAVTTATTIVGGGDSIAAISKAGVTNEITHISTGGGASLEFLGGRSLPGIAALPDK